ncbi:Bug family tripartite tricarboxylate transporter substrate binding protein [Muricoccus radiodurans]|uniref:Bug family tripartite tricarboxylate transporter substrate binding protein n=1 Tax=Muricoccus radiodurans TaxID=2231721 RepID=UPI003CF399D2
MRRMVLALAALALGVPAALAQSFPDRPVRLVIPYAAGGALDVIGRPVAEQFQRITGQPMVLENRAGANGTIAADYVAKARPDGTTLFMATSGPITVAPSLMGSLPYDAQSDLVPVTYLVNMPNALFAARGAVGQDLAGVLAAGRASPGRIPFGYPGNGSQGHLAMALMSQATGTEWLTVSYRGASQVLNDMVAGTVGLTFTTYATARGLMADGRVRPIAVAAAARTASMPDVPTFAELGYPEVEVPLWAGVMAPRGTPDAIVARLHEVLREAVTSPAVRTLMEGVGADISAQGPPDFAAMLRADHARWAGVIRRASITAD